VKPLDIIDIALGVMPDTPVSPGSHLPNAYEVTADELSGIGLTADTSRLLLHTRNSAWWAEGSTEFRKNYVALMGDGAQWLVDQGVCLIGVDYLSVQRYKNSP